MVTVSLESVSSSIALCYANDIGNSVSRTSSLFIASERVHSIRCRCRHFMIFFRVCIMARPPVRPIHFYFRFGFQVICANNLFLFLLFFFGFCFRKWSNHSDWCNSQSIWHTHRHTMPNINNIIMAKRYDGHDITNDVPVHDAFCT